MSSSTQLDANQVIKKMYDDTTGSMTMVPTYINPITLLNAIPAGTTTTSVSVYVAPYKVTGIIIHWMGLDATDGTFQVQGAHDQTNWINIGSAYTLSTASGAQDFALIDEPYAYIQCVYTHGTNTVGTVTATYMLRA